MARNVPVDTPYTVIQMRAKSKSGMIHAGGWLLAVSPSNNPYDKSYDTIRLSEIALISGRPAAVLGC